MGFPLFAGYQRHMAKPVKHTAKGSRQTPAGKTTFAVDFFSSTRQILRHVLSQTYGKKNTLTAIRRWRRLYGMPWRQGTRQNLMSGRRSRRFCRAPRQQYGLRVPALAHGKGWRLDGRYLVLFCRVLALGKRQTSSFVVCVPYFYRVYFLVAHGKIWICRVSSLSCVLSGTRQKMGLPYAQEMGHDKP